MGKPSASQPQAGRSLLRKIHQDEGGAVSIETVLILAAISLPVLIFLMKFAFPKIKDHFEKAWLELFGDGAGSVGGE